MNKLSEWLKSKKVNFWLCFASLVTGLVALIVYLSAGLTQFDPDYSVRTIVALVVGVVLGAVALAFTRKDIILLQYLAFFFGFLCYITSQMNLLANILYNVDGSSLPAAFVFILLLAIAAFVLPIVACCLTKGEKHE